MHVTHQIQVWNSETTTLTGANNPEGYWSTVYTGEDEKQAFETLKAFASRGNQAQWTWRPLGE